jgi:hypothetical protein
MVESRWTRRISNLSWLGRMIRPVSTGWIPAKPRCCFELQAGVQVVGELDGWKDAVIGGEEGSGSAERRESVQ